MPMRIEALSTSFSSCAAVLLLLGGCQAAPRPHRASSTRAIAHGEIPPPTEAQQRCLERARSGDVFPESVGAFTRGTCVSAHECVFVRNGSLENDDASIRRIHVAVSPEFAQVELPVSIGLCDPPEANSPRRCLGLSGRLCRVDTTELLLRVEGLLASAGQDDVPLGIVLNLYGAAGPRCEAADSACLPRAYQDSDAAAYEADSSREPTSNDGLARYGRGVCDQDGDCIVAGCGNHCVSWWNDIEAGTCEGYDAPETFCGCVENRCQWFEQ